MFSTADILLHDIARKIQLSPTLYNLAAQRYDTIYDWLRREGSPVKSVLTRGYAQGSMMIGSSISSKVDTDEFDLDFVIELGWPTNTPPRAALDTVYHAIRGERGSRYYDATSRQTRCVTIDYQNMHLDVTPALLLPLREARTSVIFHSNPEDPPLNDYQIVANPWGFGTWFSERTPLAPEVMEAARLRKMAEPVEDQESVEDKSLALISLQLTKRWRNIKHDSRVKNGGRKAPSVLIAKLIADNAPDRGRSLHAELMRHVAYIYSVVKAAHDANRTIVVRNPKCNEDVFSDRWPESPSVQAAFLNDLADLHADLRRLGEAPVPEKQAILMRLFGENTARTVVEAFNKRAGIAAAAGRLHHFADSGMVALGTSGLAGAASSAPSSSTRPTAPHTFFGEGNAKGPKGR